mgnify:CR=1 FL=1
MSILTVDNSSTTQEHIFDLLSISTWNECKQEVKALYQAIKNTLQEEDQDELLLKIYLDTLAEEDYSNYWNFMNR